MNTAIDDSDRDSIIFRYKLLPREILSKIYLEYIRKRPISIIYDYLKNKWDPNQSIIVIWKIWVSDRLCAEISLTGCGRPIRLGGKVIPIKKGFFKCMQMHIHSSDNTCYHLYMNNRDIPIDLINPHTIMSLGVICESENIISKEEFLKSFSEILKTATHLEMKDYQLNNDNNILLNIIL